MLRPSLARTIAVGALAMMAVIVAAPAAGAASVTVVAAGDIAGRSIRTSQRQTAALVSDISPARVLILGDAQYEKGTLTEFMQSYDRTWGQFNDAAAPVPGNHEYETANANGYFQYFDEVLRSYSPAAADSTKGYYAFNVGDWHIVALNSNCSAPGVSCSSQRSWLRSDLQADDHLCEIVYLHNDSRSFATPAADLGVDLFLSGHKHTYERWNDRYGQGMRQLVVGTGGFSLTSPSAEADAGVKAYGVAKLTLNASSYAWQFLDVAGRVRDSGSDSCHR